MRKKFLIPSVLAGILIAGLSAAALHYTAAFAKGQPPKQITAAERMSRYSPPKKQHSNETVRKSRLKQMNIVGEAATVLNILPITIIDEMKKGKTIAQIAKDKGLSEKEFTQKITDLEDKEVNTAEGDGTISKKHADVIKEGRSDRLKKAIKEKAMNVNDHMAMDMGN